MKENQDHNKKYSSVKNIFDQLCDDVVLHIFKFIPMRYLKNEISSFNKRFRKLFQKNSSICININYVYKYSLDRTSGKRISEFFSIIEKFNYIKKLIVDFHCLDVNSEFCRLISIEENRLIFTKHLQYLEEIKFSVGRTLNESLQRSFLENLGEIRNNVKKISIDFIFPYSMLLNENWSKFPNLVELDIKDTKFGLDMKSKLNFPKLKIMSLSHVKFAKKNYDKIFGSPFESVEKFVFNGNAIPDLLFYVSKYFPNLKTLKISNYYSKFQLSKYILPMVHLRVLKIVGNKVIWDKYLTDFFNGKVKKIEKFILRNSYRTCEGPGRRCVLIRNLQEIEVPTIAKCCHLLSLKLEVLKTNVRVFDNNLNLFMYHMKSIKVLHLCFVVKEYHNNAENLMNPEIFENLTGQIFEYMKKLEFLTIQIPRGFSQIPKIYEFRIPLVESVPVLKKIELGNVCVSGKSFVNFPAKQIELNNVTFLNSSHFLDLKLEHTEEFTVKNIKFDKIQISKMVLDSPNLKTLKIKNWKDLEKISVKEGLPSSKLSKIFFSEGDIYKFCFQDKDMRQFPSLEYMYFKVNQGCMIDKEGFERIEKDFGVKIDYIFKKLKKKRLVDPNSCKHDNCEFKVRQSEKVFICKDCEKTVKTVPINKSV